MRNDAVIKNATTADLNNICDIQNHHILHTDDIYSEQLKNLNELQLWYESQMDQGFPILVAEVKGEFAGFATYGSFRKRPCYRTTVEHSVYLGSKFQGFGLGRALMEELFKIAKSNQHHAMIGGIDSKNQNSIDFHRKLGFTEVARVPEVAQKKGKWLELVLMQKIL